MTGQSVMGNVFGNTSKSINIDFNEWTDYSFWYNKTYVESQIIGWAIQKIITALK